MADKDVALMAHLMRRAGFGAARDELEVYIAKGYEATVEELLHPEDQPDWEDDLYHRALPELIDSQNHEISQVIWSYRMINTKCPLEEKMALFWHSVLCCGHAKVDHARQLAMEIDMFRRLGLGSFRDLLIELSRDPAMVFFLDNSENHKGSINENYGRELLELFSLGVGMDGQLNYTEDDVKAASQAFTGWNNQPAFPNSHMVAPTGSSSTTRQTTMTARRPSWVRRGAGTARTSSTSLCASRRPPGSSPDTCTTFLSPTSPRCLPGRIPPLRIWRQSRPWRRPLSRATATCAR